MLRSCGWPLLQRASSQTAIHQRQDATYSTTMYLREPEMPAGEAVQTKLKLNESQAPRVSFYTVVVHGRRTYRVSITKKVSYGFWQYVSSTVMV